jgi:translation elongation factor EF-Tu-like GTPase
MELNEYELQLDDANCAKEREMESANRLRKEIADLKQKSEIRINESDDTASLCKRRYQESIAELTAHVDSLNKTKSKNEKEMKHFLLQIEELRNENENLSRAKVS